MTSLSSTPAASSRAPLRLMEDEDHENIPPSTGSANKAKLKSPVWEAPASTLIQAGNSCMTTQPPGPFRRGEPPDVDVPLVYPEATTKWLGQCPSVNGPALSPDLLLETLPELSFLDYTMESSPLSTAVTSPYVALRPDTPLTFREMARDMKSTLTPFFKYLNMGKHFRSSQSPGSGRQGETPGPDVSLLYSEIIKESRKVVERLGHYPAVESPGRYFSLEDETFPEVSMLDSTVEPSQLSMVSASPFVLPASSRDVTVEERKVSTENDTSSEMGPTLNLTSEMTSVLTPACQKAIGASLVTSTDTNYMNAGGSLDQVKQSKPEMSGPVVQMLTEMLSSITQESILPDNITQESILPDNVTQESIIHNNVTQESIIHNNVTQESIIHNNITHEAILPDNVTQESIIHNNVTQESIIHNNVTHEAILPDNITQESIIHNNVTQNCSRGNKSAEDKTFEAHLPGSSTLEGSAVVCQVTVETVDLHNETKELMPAGGSSEALPVVVSASGGAASERREISQLDLPGLDGLSESLTRVVLSTNKAQTFNLDDSLDMRLESLVTSTPLPDCRTFHLSAEAAQAKSFKRLYAEGPRNPPLDVPADPKTSAAPAARSLLPPGRTISHLLRYDPAQPSTTRRTSKLPAPPPQEPKPNTSVIPAIHTTLPGAKQPNNGLKKALPTGIPSTNQRALPTLRPPSARLNVTTSINDKPSGSIGVKQPNNGLKKALPTGIPSTNQRVLPTLRPPSARLNVTTSINDKPSGSIAVKPPQSQSHAKRILQTRSGALPLAKRKRTAPCSPSSETPRSRKGPSLRGAPQPSKTHAPGDQTAQCANCAQLRQEMEKNAVEMRRLREEIIRLKGQQIDH